MGIGCSNGENRAVEAAKQAIQSPLLETSIEGAKGVLLNITGGPNLGLFEVNEAAELVSQSADPDANIIFGAVIDEDLKDEIRITVIATGFSGDKPRKVISERAETKDRDSLFGDYEGIDLDIPTFLRKNKSIK